MAGYSALSEAFTTISVIDRLAGGDITKWDKVREMMIGEVYAKVVYDSHKNQCDSLYRSLINKSKGI